MRVQCYIRHGVERARCAPDGTISHQTQVGTSDSVKASSVNLS